MSSNVTDPAESKTTPNPAASPKGKGKSKAHTDIQMEDEEEEEEEEEEAASGEEDEDEVDETFDEIDPAAILPTGRRTRGIKVDYTSKEALAKAGLKEADKDDDSDDDVEMKD